MIQVTTHASVQPAASGNIFIISKSGIIVVTRKGRHCECGSDGTAVQLVVSGNHCIISDFREEYFTGKRYHYECGAAGTAVQLSV